MAKQKQPFNPFYAALIIVGVAFTVTACAYALLMVRATRPQDSYTAAAALSPDEESTLMELLDQRGMEILGVEVLLLAVATAGAIGLDQYRSGRAHRPGGPAGTSTGRHGDSPAETRQAGMLE